MASNLTQPRSAGTTSFTPCAFELSPAEIRNIIYQCLFGDLQTTFHIRLLNPIAHVYKDSPQFYAKLKRDELEQRYGGPDLVSRVQPQVEPAAALLSVSHMIRNEVAPLVYPNLHLGAFENHVLLKLQKNFTPLAKQLIHRLAVMLPGRFVQERGQLCSGLEMMTGLRGVRFTYADRLADPAIKGTAWKPGTLQRLKVMRKALSHLNQIHYAPPDLGSYVEVHFASIPPTDASETILDIDTEYQRWLDANKQRSLAKEAVQDVQEETADGSGVQADA